MKTAFLLISYFSSLTFAASDTFVRDLIGNYKLIQNSGSFDKLNDDQKCFQNLKLAYFSDGNELCRTGIAMSDVSFCNPEILPESLPSEPNGGDYSLSLRLSRVSKDSIQSGGFILRKTSTGVEFIIQPSRNFYQDPAELTALCRYKKI